MVSTGTRDAAAVKAWVKIAQPGETAPAIAWIMASTLRRSIDGSQLVSMNTRCPLTICAANMPNRSLQDMAAHRRDKHCPKLEERRDARLALFRRSAPGRHDHDHRSAIGAHEDAKLDRQFFRGGCRNLGAAFEHPSGLSERKQQHAGPDAGQFVQAMMHRRHDAEIAATAAKRPEQLGFAGFAGGHDAAVRENDFGREQIVEPKSKAPDARPIAATKRKARHADSTAGARHRRKAVRIGDAKHVQGAGSSANSRAAMVGSDDRAVHGAQVNHESIAQRAACPVMAATAHRQREISVTGYSNGRLSVLGCPTVNHRLRHGTYRLCPNSGCRRVAIAARYRYIARHLLAESAQRLSDHIHHPTPISR